jgi:hypothetical protein
MLTVSANRDALVFEEALQPIALRQQQNGLRTPEGKMGPVGGL